MDHLFNIAVIDIRLLDVFDILIVAYLMYKIYTVLKGSLAFNIFVGVALLYVVYFLVDTLQMNLLSLLLGKFVGFGVLILIIIFQPEIRNFLLALGNSTLKGRMNLFNKWFNPPSEVEKEKKQIIVASLSKAIRQMSKSKTGALIVSDFSNTLDQYIATGTVINGKISEQLMLNIFFKNSPLHDGAMIINLDKVKAASCILPLTDRIDLPKNLGLRHRAAVGITEQNNAVAIVVSEETGNISVAKKGEIKRIKDISNLEKTLLSYF